MIPNDCVWETYVLVNKNCRESWYAMNVVPDEIDCLFQKDPINLGIEKWWYYRDSKQGDILTKKEIIV